MSSEAEQDPAVRHPAAGERRRVAVASGAALLAAVVALVAVVLPAEYGVDPLGSGKALGLLALAEPRQDALHAAASGYRPDQVSFRLEPFESVEYKYRLEAGGVLVFAWRASGPVLAELHAEPDGAPPGFAESFDKVRSAASDGSYRAPFDGWHGWFWENRGTEAVTVELRAAGFFSRTRIYRGGHLWEQAPDVTPAEF